MKTEKEEKVQLPKWSLSDIYTGFDDAAYQRDIEEFKNICSEISQRRYDENSTLQETLEQSVQLIGRAMDIYETLYSFAFAIFSVNTADERASKEVSQLEGIHPLLSQCLVSFRKRVKSVKKEIPELIKKSPILAQRSLFIKEAAVEAEHQLSDSEENLAEELKASGGEAWGHLQEAVASALEADGESVNQLRNMAYSPRRTERKAAYKKELAAWKRMEVPLAYSLCGVKKCASTLDLRRGWKSALEKSLFQSRMTKKTLDAMISVMEESLPIFRRYLNRKCTLLGLKKLAFYDLFAPVIPKGFTPKVWSYDEAKGYIIKNFGEFSPDMGLFAKNAFDSLWIDAPVHPGKVGGAYCTSFPLTKESRVMCNFSPTFSGVATIAHELGHAYHFDLLKEECAFSRAYPMTLAETASVFSETLLFNNAMADSKGFEKKYLTEIFLMETTQVIVDILCRFYFEKNLFERIKASTLSAGELCDMMLDAQKATYGDALDSKNLHPYMWAVKCHYYSPDLGFYNYPYAFAQLFSIALYQRYLEDRANFPGLYKEILMATGRKDIKGVAKIAGMDVEKKDFFQDAMDFIEKKVKSYLS